MQSRLLKAAMPYYLVFAFLTVAPPTIFGQLRHCRRRIFWSIYVLYTLLMLAISFWQTYINNKLLVAEVIYKKQDDISSVLGLVRYILISIVLCVIQLNSVIYFRRLCEIFEMVATLEHNIDDFDNVQQCMGLRCRLVMRTGALALFLFIMLPVVNMPLTAAEDLSIMWRILSVYVIAMGQLKTVEYCLLVQLVQELLFALQHNLLQLKHDLAKCVQPAMLRALCMSLRRNQRLLAETWHLVDAIENYFTLPMLFLFLFNGIAITHAFNWAYINALNPNDCCRYLRLTSILILIVNMLIPCSVSQCCINTYNNFTVILPKLKFVGSDIALTMCLREYSLQLMHQKITFTCGGFFDINMKYFGGLMITITTYVIILIQFKMQSEIDRETQNKI